MSASRVTLTRQRRWETALGHSKDLPCFRNWASAPPPAHPLARLGYDDPTPIQTQGDSRRSDRRRSAGARPDRHGQDRRVRPADDRAPLAPAPAPAARRRAGSCSSRRGSWRVQVHQALVGLRRADAASRRRHLRRRRHGRTDPGAAPRHGHRRGRRPAASSITCSGGPSTSPRSRCSRWTKPIGCWTWASCPRSGASFAALPRHRQTLLFSATLSEGIVRLAGGVHARRRARGCLRPAGRRGDRDASGAPRRRGAQARRADAHPDAEGAEQALVFCKTKRGANRVGDDLEQRGRPRRASSTATRARVRARARSTTSRRVACACWSPRTSRRAASTSRSCRWSSTSTCRSWPRTTCIASGRTGRAGQQRPRGVAGVGVGIRAAARHPAGCAGAARAGRDAHPERDGSTRGDREACPDPRGSWLPVGAGHFVREPRSAVQRRQTPPRRSSRGRRPIVSRVTAASAGRRRVARDHRTGLEIDGFQARFFIGQSAMIDYRRKGQGRVSNMHNSDAGKVVYWHRDLPPLDAELMAEHTIEATSDRVEGTISHRDELWDRCYQKLMANTQARLAQEIARLGGHYAHVHDESIDVRHDDATCETWLHGRFSYMLYISDVRMISMAAGLWHRKTTVIAALSIAGDPRASGAALRLPRQLRALTRFPCWPRSLSAACRCSMICFGSS